ncbi:carotenoid biosynthesis protein [Marinifilum sp.]|uniref:carotenoid biosynthesis protein n=1 Tax=Marinifilum sp. TaxID=2033137 RepID=UPI003BAC520E
MKQEKTFFASMTLLVLLAFLQAFFNSIMQNELINLMQTVILTIFVLYHGVYRYGWGRLLVMFVIVFATGWIFESLSIATGFPFGNYEYSDLLGVKLGTVPFAIMPAYFAMGFISWTIASILHSKTDNTIKGSELITMPLVASFVMSSWDVTGDPQWSSIVGRWTWFDGGEYFGVPFTNYLGWFFVVFIFYFVFALMDRYKTVPVKFKLLENRKYWIFAPLIYLHVLVEALTNYISKPNLEVVSKDGHTWWTGDIYGSLLLVGMWTMLPIALYAILRLKKDFK